jgi:hypothetical protein
VIIKPFLGFGFVNISFRYIIGLTAVCILLFSYFDNESFAMVYNIAIVAFLFISFRNYDLFALVITIAAIRGYQEFIWYLLDDSYSSKGIVYISIISLCSWLFYDKLAKLLLLLVALSIVADIYWYFTQYDSPNISWDLANAVSMLVARHIFIVKSAYIATWTNSEPKSLDIDFYLFMILSVQFFVHIAAALEYLVRHLTDLNPLFIYNSVSVTVHFLAITIVAILSIESIKEISRQLFKA